MHYMYYIAESRCKTHSKHISFMETFESSDSCYSVSDFGKLPFPQQTLQLFWSLSLFILS